MTLGQVPVTVPVVAEPPPGVAFVCENYTKFEYKIPMRDWARLFATVYVPKAVFTDAKTYPIMLSRTPYNGVDKYRGTLGPSELFEREKSSLSNQQLVRGEPFRGKDCSGFENPVPFEPGQPDFIKYQLPDVAHTFRAGHRIMVQMQSSCFPMNDRNPQKFMEIPKAVSADFQKATQHVYRGGADGSRIEFRVVN